MMKEEEEDWETTQEKGEATQEVVKEGEEVMGKRGEVTQKMKMSLRVANHASAIVWSANERLMMASL